MFFRLLCRADDFQPAGRRKGEGGRRRAERGRRRGSASLSAFPLPPSPFCRPRPLHSPIVRHGDRLLAGEIRPGNRTAASGHLVRGALGHDLPAVAAGGRAEIEQLVGVLDNFAVVLDHQQRIAQVAKLLERVQQPAIVAGVQADGGFIEHVEDSAQAAADLRGQTDALHFAAGKRGGGPGKRQVVQTHVHQELQSVANLAGHFAGHFALGLRRLPALKFLQQPAQRQAAEFVDRPAGRKNGDRHLATWGACTRRLLPLGASPRSFAHAKPHGRRIVAESAAAAHGTLHFVDEVFELRTEGGRDTACLLQGRIQALVLEAECETAGCHRTLCWGGS